MNEFFSRNFYGNTISEWAVAIGIIVGAVILGKLAYWFFSRIVKAFTKRTKSKLDDILVDKVEEPVIFAIAIAGVWYGLGTLAFSAGAQTAITNGTFFLIIFNIAWFLVRFLEAIVQEYVTPMVERSESDLDDQLLPIAKKAIKVGIWVLAFVIGLNNAGYDVGALLAGLGIGGLALALAAQDTVANLFGGFTIIADKAFGLGDRVKISGFDGSIESIGLRATKLRTLEGRLVNIPNKTFTNSPTENVSSEPNRKVVLNLGLTYDTTDAQIQQAMNTLSDIAKANTDIEEKHLLSFNAFGDFSLNILFIYYIKKEADILGVQTAMNLQILQQFNAAGLDFAFPSQTIYHQPLA